MNTENVKQLCSDTKTIILTTRIYPEEPHIGNAGSKSRPVNFFIYISLLYTFRGSKFNFVNLFFAAFTRYHSCSIFNNELDHTSDIIINGIFHSIIHMLDHQTTVHCPSTHFIALNTIHTNSGLYNKGHAQAQCFTTISQQNTTIVLPPSFIGYSYCRNMNAYNILSHIA